MSALHALALAILQGVAELFPISSLGHAVIVPPLLGWSTIDQHSSEFLPFIVVLHVGTAVALLLYFWRDWAAIASGILGGRGSPKSADAWNALGLIVVATLPAVAIGFLFEKLVRGLFASPLIAALFLIVNGFLLLLGEWLRQHDSSPRPGAERPIAAFGWRGALAVGIWQCAAFIPGISRSGAAMIGVAIRNEKCAASVWCSPLTRPPTIAAPEREMPGINAAHCQMPTASAPRQPNAAIGRSAPGRGDESCWRSHSPSSSRNPLTIRNSAAISGEAKRPRTSFSNRKPIATAGRVATTISPSAFHASADFGLPRPPRIPEAIAAQSRQK